LFESSAIAFHVASDDLRGKDNVQRALVQQWVSFADNELLPAACSWVFPVVGVLDQCKELTDRAAQDLKAALSVLDQYLLHATFLAGERITLADICVACTLLLPFQNVLDPAVR
jgi:elongation factor 1-gamma